MHQESLSRPVIHRRQPVMIRRHRIYLVGGEFVDADLKDEKANRFDWFFLPVFYKLLPLECKPSSIGELYHCIKYGLVISIGCNGVASTIVATRHITKIVPTNSGEKKCTVY
jgi:hypothetical protein